MWRAAACVALPEARRAACLHRDAALVHAFHISDVPAACIGQAMAPPWHST
ncbi:hypothetical protein XOCgx_2607 [Xanthomonas oryzae pv. oryzicola]|nr:hypothetical protein XOCgx_2607 [Xanthomonas oryzae pv. oryzicola]